MSPHLADNKGEMGGTVNRSNPAIAAEPAGKKAASETVQKPKPTPLGPPQPIHSDKFSTPRYRGIKTPHPINIPAWARILYCNAKELGCFQPMDNSYFLELVRYAKSKGKTFKIDDKPLGTLFVRSFDDQNNYARQINQVLDTGVFNDKFHYIPYSVRDVVPAKPSRVNSSLKKLAFDGVTPNSSKEPIPICTVITYVDIGNNEFRLTVVNSLENKILYQESYPINFLLHGLPAIFREAKEGVKLLGPKITMGQLPPLSQEEVERIESQVVFDTLNNQQEISQRIRREWKEAPEQLERIELEVWAPFYEPNFGDAAKVSIEVTQEDLERHNFAPIVIRAPGRMIDFTTFNKRGSGVGRPLMPVFAESRNDPKFYPLEIDISVVKGGGKLRHTFYQEALLPTREEGDCKIYSAGGEDLLKKHEKDMAVIQNGIRRVESDFGKNPGSVVRKVYLADYLPSQTAMHVSDTQPDMVWVHDESLIYNRPALEWVGQHEALHSFDFQFKLSSDPQFKGWFDKLKKEGHIGFLKKVTEKNLYKISLGGNTGKNELEFFASLVNSVNSPRLARELQQLTPRHRTYYIKSLRIAKEVIARKVSSDAPIIAKINRAIRTTQ